MGGPTTIPNPQKGANCGSVSQAFLGIFPSRWLKSELRFPRHQIPCDPPLPQLCVLRGGRDLALGVFVAVRCWRGVQLFDMVRSVLHEHFTSLRIVRVPFPNCIMHVPIDQHREYGKMMNSVSTTAKRTLSNPSTKPSMKDIIIADAGEGVTKEPWRDKVERASNRDHTKSTLSKAGMYVTNHSNQEREEHIMTRRNVRQGLASPVIQKVSEQPS